MGCPPAVHIVGEEMGCGMRSFTRARASRDGFAGLATSSSAPNGFAFHRGDADLRQGGTLRLLARSPIRAPRSARASDKLARVRVGRGRDARLRTARRYPAHITAMSLRARKRASAVTRVRSRLRHWATSMRSNGSRWSQSSAPAVSASAASIASSRNPAVETPPLAAIRRKRACPARRLIAISQNEAALT